MTHDPPLFVRHPDHQTGLVVGYHSVVGHDNKLIAFHLYEDGHATEALDAAKHCSDRHELSHVNSCSGTAFIERVYESHPVKHDVRPSVWDGPVGTTVTVRGPGGTYVQEEL